MTWSIWREVLGNGKTEASAISGQDSYNPSARSATSPTFVVTGYGTACVTPSWPRSTWHPGPGRQLAVF